MVFAQKCPFFETSVFYGKIGQENIFYDILERKNAILGYQKRRKKNCIILKGLIHGFCTKMSFFWNFCFLRQNRPGKYLLRYSKTEKRLDHILERKNAFLASINQKIKKSKNWHFSKGFNPRFWFKNGQFFIFCFLGNICQEHVFYDILERKNAILGYKKRSSKTRKIAIILKELTHGFCTKMAIFPTSFFKAI